MKRILSMMLIAVPGLVFLGCEQLSNPTAVPLSDQGEARRLAKAPDTFSETRTFSVDAQSQTPCENQTIDIGGSLEAKFTYTLVGSSYELTLQPRAQEVSGVGLTTGVEYKGTGTSPSEFIGQVGVQETFQSSFPMNSQGPSQDIEVLTAWHVLIDENGNLSVSVDILQIECQ